MNKHAPQNVIEVLYSIKTFRTLKYSLKKIADISVKNI